MDTVSVPAELLAECLGAALEARDWAKERGNRDQQNHWSDLAIRLQAIVMAEGVK